jgi:predicted O-linked N-acetylglucosamine transferase (SPINDLY family)
MLDTFPQNGGISTWEALWMGAPVLAVLGNQPASRISGAILHALGMDEWIAEDEAAYLRLAVDRASDLSSLARFRQGIRSRIESSPAGNPEQYTRAVEEGYRAMWQQWLVLNP